MDWLQNNIVYLTGWNGALQAALMMLLGTMLSIVVSLHESAKKMKLQKDNYDKEVREFKEKLEAERAKTYKEIITKERIKWVSDLRSNVVSYLGMIQYLMQKRMTFILNKDGSQEELKVFLKSIEDDFTTLIKLYYAIIAMLNPNDNYENKEVNHVKFKEEIILLNAKIADVLRDESFGGGKYKDVDIEIGNFADSCQALLQYEWDNVKKEAKAIYLENKSAE